MKLDNLMTTDMIPTPGVTSGMSTRGRGFEIGHVVCASQVITAVVSADSKGQLALAPAYRGTRAWGPPLD